MNVVEPTILVDASGQPLGLPSPKPLTGRRILLVEDLPEPTRAVARSLHEAGGEVVLECHAMAAVTLVQRAPKPFDALVLDLQLALFDTLQAVRQLRQRGYDRHIVGVIPVEEQLLGKLLHSAGCTAVLPRPVEPWQLVATLSAA